MAVTLGIIAGCGGGDGTASGGSKPEELTGLENVKAVHWQETGRLSWDVSISPDGGRYVVKRNVSPRVNTTEYRVEVDGQPGPRTFYDVRGMFWAPDGRTVAYIGIEGGPKPKNYVVVEGQLFGPYPEVRTFRFDPTGGGRWAATTQDLSSGNLVIGLVTNGGPVTPLPFPGVSDEFRLDASGKPAFPFAYTKWRDLSGREVPEPPDPNAPFVMNLPAKGNLAVNLLKPPKRLEPRRQQLTMNGAEVGTFDQVFGRGQGDKWSPGYQQPDGQVWVYAVENRRLIRLRLKP